MLEDLITKHETGNTFPEKNPVVSAFIDRQDMGETEFQPPSFGIRKEYHIEIKVGVNFLANSAQYKRQEDLAIKQLKHALYKDIIGDIYEALNICDDVQTKNILDRMLTKIL